MSGSAGHIRHPYECLEFTFGELKNIFELIGENKLDVREKFDGQNLQITWKDGRVLAARRKSQIKNRGEKALPYDQIADHMFSDSTPEEIVIAFASAIKTLDRAFNGAAYDNGILLKSLFKEGYNFLNVEIINRSTTNIIPYNHDCIVIHNLHEYDDDGNLIDDYTYDKSILNANKIYNILFREGETSFHRSYQIIKPTEIDYDGRDVNVHVFIESINSLMSFGEFDNSNTLGEHVELVFNGIISQLPHSNNVSDEQRQGLINRWVYEDKSYDLRTIKSDFSGSLLDEILFIEDEIAKELKKKVLLPYKKIFLQFGHQLFGNRISSLFTDSSEQARIDIYNKYDEASDLIISSNGKSERYRKEIELFDSIVTERSSIPLIEGCVFSYKNNLLKLTGSFAPLNQIIGYLKFNK